MKKSFLIFAGLLATILLLKFFFDFSHLEEWRQGWEYRYLDDQELSEFSTSLEDLSFEYSSYRIPNISLESPPKPFLVLRKKWIKRDNFQNPTLYLRGLVSTFDIVCNGHVLGTQFYRGSQADSNLNTIPREIESYKYNTKFFPILSLPEHCNGQYIYVIFFELGNLPLGFTEPPLYGDAITNYRSLSNRYQSFASLGFFFLILGFFSLYLFVRRKKKPLIAFTGFSIISGIHFLSQVGFFGYYYYDNITLNFYIFIISLFLIPITCLYFFDKLFGIGRWNIIRMLWQFHLVFSVIVLGLTLTENISVINAIVMFFWICFPAMVLQVIVSIREYVLRKPKAWILIVGSSLLLLFNGHDILSSLSVFETTIRVSPWGFFLFVLSLTIYGENLFRESEIKFNSLQKEIQTAARIQNAILPPLEPKWENTKIDVYYQPSHEVGGDFYDFQALGGNKYGILIADVVGHGLGASIIASLSKFAFFQNYKHWANPSFLLSAMNNDLVKKSFGRFTTATYICIDREKQKFVISNAGHPSFLHWKSKESKLVEIKPKGKPLGILPELVFFEEEYVFESGDRFLFYTDGLTEEENAKGEEFGIQNLMDCFFTGIQKNPRDPISYLISKFHEFTEMVGHPHDDVTLIHVEIL